MQSSFQFLKGVEAHFGAVEHMAYDRSRRLLASAGSGFPQVWTLSEQSYPSVIVLISYSIYLERSSLLSLVSPKVEHQQEYICNSVNFTSDGYLVVTYLEQHAV